MDNDDGDNPLADHVVVLLIAIGSAAFIVSMYHVIAICLCNRRITTDQNPREQQQPPPPTLTTFPVAHMIPSHKFHKTSAVDHGDEDGTCAVCLGDFEEGAELRRMPECMHCFHMACIDMWLSCHSSCPVCRASATPSLEMLNSVSDHHFHNFAYHQQHSIS
ncbi:hypothetical protein RJT34_06250 [Clitoria ternatea]|uniref:RING-type domain-containing protein n=1 Tax=Clitoria ternatea TaxID=43366 RepID=A0AAN9K387_CLITE